MGGSVDLSEQETPVARFRRALWVLIPVWTLLIYVIVRLVG